MKTHSVKKMGAPLVNVLMVEGMRKILTPFPRRLTNESGLS